MLKNTVKTSVLLAGLGGLIVTVAGVLGGGSTGALLIGLVLAIAMVGGSYWFSDRLALRSAKATVIGPDDHPLLYQTVANLAQQAGMPMPTVAISPDLQPNAFATGRGPNHAVVCATEGLLAELPPDELAAVMAHELMHVKHRDILIGSVAAAIATAISFVANMAMWATAFGGGDDDDSPNPLALLATALLAPIAASLMQMAISRSREFDADRGAAELLGSGEPLARALRRIEAMAARRPMEVAPAQAHAYIHNPLAEFNRPGGRGLNLARLFSTHPSTDARIERLLAAADALSPPAGPHRSTAPF
ncbi:MAG: M48 family metalloprotease [Acidimicrobiales bacterium]